MKKKVIRVTPEAAKKIKRNGYRWLNDAIQNTEKFPEVPQKRDLAPVRIFIKLTDANFELLKRWNLSGLVEAIAMATPERAEKKRVRRGRPSRSKYDPHADYIWERLEMGVAIPRIAEDLSLPVPALRAWIHKKQSRKPGLQRT